MCRNYSICWLRIIKGGKLVWYNVVVTNFCSNFCCKTTRSRENTHYLLTYVVGCGVVSQHLWCFSAWVAHYTYRREHCGGSNPAVSPFFRLGGLARSQISARIGARQSNRRGNLSRGVFPYAENSAPAA